VIEAKKAGDTLTGIVKISWCAKKIVREGVAKGRGLIHGYMETLKTERQYETRETKETKSSRGRNVTYCIYKLKY
jgi:hypothetical protein